MAESYIQLPPDSSGKKVRTIELTIGENTVHQEVYTVADSEGNIVIGNIYASQDFTDPSSNPTLDLDLKGRKQVEVYVKSINPNVTVNIYGSVDGSTWRKTYTAQTDDNGEYADGFLVGYRYIRVEVVDTGTGTVTIEIAAV